MWSIFGSGYDIYNLSTYEPINVNFMTTHLKPVSTTEKLLNYGFDPTYWMANDHQVVSWPKKSLAYRFQNKDYARYTTGEKVSLY